MLTFMQTVAVLLVREHCSPAKACLFLKESFKKGLKESVEQLRALEGNMVVDSCILSFSPESNLFSLDHGDNRVVSLTKENIQDWSAAKTAMVREACCKLLIRDYPSHINQVEWF